jgi:hypothetical protein
MALAQAAVNSSYDGPRRVIDGGLEFEPHRPSGFRTLALQIGLSELS